MKFALALAALLVAFAGSAHAQRVSQLPGMTASATADRIAAVVNDNVITSADIEQRMKLAFLASGLPDAPDVRAHLLPQILRALVDEQLQLQEAKRLDISVSKEEVEKALQSIARDNHIPVDMRTFLKDKGGSPESLEDQIRAGISWNKVIQRELRPRVDVGDDEVESAIARVRANSGKQEYLVSEIFLSVDNAKDEDQVRQSADNLVQQIKHGANFAGVARQFSQSTGAASGGDIGWIQDGQLPAELNKTLQDMPTGSIAGPVRSSNGYHILALREKRTVSLDGGDSEPLLDIQQAFRATGSDADKSNARIEARNMGTTITSCNDLEGRLKVKFPSWRLQSMGSLKASQTPDWLSDKVKNLAVGKASEAMDTDKGVIVVFVCGRHAPDGKVDRDAIASAIGSEKLELQARRLMRDLRRSGYIDIRVH